MGCVRLRRGVNPIESRALAPLVDKIFWGEYANWPSVFSASAIETDRHRIWPTKIEEATSRLPAWPEIFARRSNGTHENQWAKLRRGDRLQGFAVEFELCRRSCRDIVTRVAGDDPVLRLSRFLSVEPPLFHAGKIRFPIRLASANCAAVLTGLAREVLTSRLPAPIRKSRLPDQINNCHHRLQCGLAPSNDIPARMLIDANAGQ